MDYFKISTIFFAMIFAGISLGFSEFMEAFA